MTLRSDEQTANSKQQPAGRRWLEVHAVRNLLPTAHSPQPTSFLLLFAVCCLLFATCVPARHAGSAEDEAFSLINFFQGWVVDASTN